MRRHRVVFLLLLIVLYLALPFNCSLGGQWTRQRQEVIYVAAINGVSTVRSGSDWGTWVVGTKGAILHRSSAMDHWEEQNSGCTNSLSGVSFVDCQNGWTVGKPGTILQTSNGGAVWEPQASPVEDELVVVQFLDAQEGWIVDRMVDQSTHTGTLLHTTNGGTDWEIVYIPNIPGGSSQAFLRDLHFVDASHGWVTGMRDCVGPYPAFLFHTTNGGESWIGPVMFDDPLATSAVVWFIDTSTGWLADFEGHIRKSTNGGDDWTVEWSRPALRFYDIQFIDPSTGWALAFNTDGGGSVILGTEDGGITWPEQTVQTSQHLLALSLSDVNNGWAVGENGCIMRTEDGSLWFPEMWAGWTLYSVEFLDPRKGWAVGYSGLLITTDDGGANWLHQYCGVNTCSQLRDVDFVDTQRGWTGGDGIYRTTDGGAYWAHLPGLSASLWATSFVDENDGWITGHSVQPFQSYVYHTPDGGGSWSLQYLDYSPGVPDEDIYFTDRDYGWFCNYYGIHHTTNGGQNWPCQLHERGFCHLEFVDRNCGWAVGAGGKIKHTTNGGTDWIPQPSGTGAILYAVDFVDSRIGWAVGHHGTIVRTVDGGESWHSQSSGVPEGCLWGVSFPNPHHGWAVGCRTNPNDELESVVLKYDMPYPESSSELATAHNGGRKLCRVPNTDDLWMAYQSAGAVYTAFSSNGGATWNAGYVSEGEFPTMALDASGSPHAVWMGPQETPEGRYIKYARYVGGKWEVYDLLYYGALARPDLPSLAIDVFNNKAHLTWETTYQGPNSNRHLEYTCFSVLEPPPDPPPVETVDATYGNDWYMSPCIALDYLSPGMIGRPHIVYRKGSEGKIYYTVKNQTWSPPDLISQPEPIFTANFPFIEIWGDIIHALWAGHDPSGVLPFDEVWYRSKLVHQTDWGDLWNISESADTSQFPVLAGKYASWSEKYQPSNWEIMLRSVPAGLSIEDISQTPDRSMFSHINYRQLAQEPEYLYFAWTEGDGAVRTVKALDYPLYHPPIPHYHVETGQEQPSFYCVERDSFIQFGPEAYKQVDIDSTQLLYLLPGLKPYMRYRLIVTGYWEDDDEVSERLDIDGIAQRLIKLEPEIAETLEIWVPPAAYTNDGCINLTITLLEGDWAVIGPIVLYEFEREEGEGIPSGGGFQVAEDRSWLLPEVFALSQNYPNPFPSNTTIPYQIPPSSSQSTGQLLSGRLGTVDCRVEIYDVCGRLVKRLVEREQQPGFHSVVWDGRDSSGRLVATGVYFYRVKAGKFKSSKKMVVLR